MNRQQMVAPFAEEELHSFQGRGGQTMTYIEDETVMDRLDVGYGPGNWQVQVDPISENVVKVRLGVREAGEWAWYEDFGYPNREGGESLKEAVSDGIRRCGRFVGIARDLYRKAPDERRTDQNGPRPDGNGTARPPAPDVETEELIGDFAATGMVRNGSASGYKLEPRQGPTGHVIGFRMEFKDEKSIPQVLVEGPAGEALYLATSMNPAALLDTRLHVKGRLFNVKRPGRQSYKRLRVAEWRNAEYEFPALDDAGPEPTEAPTAPLFDEPALPEPPPDLELVGEKVPAA